MCVEALPGNDQRPDEARFPPKHPGIAEVYEVLESRERVVISSELPSGKTLTGVFQATDALPRKAKSFAEATISFTFPLAASPSVEVIQAGGSASEHCPGSAEAPSAAPGYLCLYTMSSTGPVGTYSPATEAPGAARNGAVAFTELECEEVPCNARLVGTWAVTAP